MECLLVLKLNTLPKNRIILIFKFFVLNYPWCFIQIKLICSMAENQMQKFNKCQNHEFSLTPLNHQCFFTKRISVSFCDHSITLPRLKKTAKTQKIERKVQCFNGPTFNMDKNYASFAFILKSQKNYYQETADKIRNEHQKNMKDYTQQRSQLLQPKPKSRNSFCNVCKHSYEDYVEHIKSQTHRNKIKMSRFNNYILEIQNKYAQKNVDNRYDQSRIIDKMIIDRSTSVRSDQQLIDDDQELYGKTRKRVKVDPFIVEPQRQIPKVNYPIQNTCFPSIWNYPFLSQNFLPYPMLPLTCTNPANWLIPNHLAMNNLYGALQLPMYPYNQPIVTGENPNNIGHPIKKTSNNIIIVDDQQ